LKQLKKILGVIFAVIMLLSGCTNNSPAGVAPYVYMHSKEEGGYEVVEYYPDEEVKQYVNTDLYGVHYRNSYYDGMKFYFSLSHAFFVYDSTTKKIKELATYVSNAIKKINGEIWVALDHGLVSGGYVSKLCKINEEIELNCLYEVKNQQVTDFYIDFDKQVFYAAGSGVGQEAGESPSQYKVVKYDMQTGEETIVRNDGKHIIAGRLTHICPGQFITSDADIYEETGEKIGEVVGTNKHKLNAQINDIAMNETTFVDGDHNLFEVYGCENNQIKHRRTIELKYPPDLYPVYYSWETADNGEITMPIRSEDDVFEYIGMQSVNVRTGEVTVHLFDEPVYRVHAIARFV